MAASNQLIYKGLDHQEFEEMRESEKLRNRLTEMKHRLCLFEFGIGSIASLLQDADEVRKISTRSERKTGGNSSDHQKRLFEGIVKILGEVEKSLSAAEQVEEIQHETFRQDQLSSATGVPCLVEVNPNVVTNTKARIFIDETETGGNSLTRSICNIQVVENSAIFSAGGNNAALSAAPRSHYADPALAALSTLAAVATNQMQARSVKNEIGTTDNNLSQRSLPQITEDGLEKHVKKETSHNVPFKKRKLMDRNVKNFAFKRPRDVA